MGMMFKTMQSQRKDAQVALTFQNPVPGVPTCIIRVPDYQVPGSAGSGYWLFKQLHA